MYQNHLPHEMALSHFGEQHLGESPSVLRGILPEQLSHGSSDSAAAKESKEILRPPQAQLGGGGGGSGPTWLNSAILRQQSQYADGSFLHLQTTSDSTASPASVGGNPWMQHRPILQRNSSDIAGSGGGDDVPVSSDSMIAAAGISHGSAELNNGGRGRNQVAASSGELQEGDAAAASQRGGGEEEDGMVRWQMARYKADILAHPLYEQLLSAHVACLRIATPVDQLPRIDAQLAQSQHVVAKYSVLGHGNQLLAGDDKELDQFMVRFLFLSITHKILFLFSCSMLCCGFDLMRLKKKKREKQLLLPFFFS